MNIIRLLSLQQINYRPLSVHSRLFCTIMVFILTFASSSLMAKENTSNRQQSYRTDLDAVTDNRFASDFELPDRNGNRHRLADYQGRIVVVNFWSTWCIPCRIEMPALERAWKRLEPSGIVLLAIAMQDELSSVNNFLDQSPVSFPVLLDHDGKVAGEWRVVGIPVTYILDASGRIVYKATGIREWDSDSIISIIAALSKNQETGESK
ncbi:TlpA disulfide reductase family protein [Sedimenticola hydrogenitrophicus]|uniref:TlpA disulfide reductase family protein n=1 Tax=Sedimenticola hydrogenitrophicus TaxID=2967975 RepID=UPI0021A740A0|nr:TlpA disulfide reductase family protein [Sedimenticola hydrogenitrophicus]